MKTKRAFKYRFYPTPEQVALLAQTFGCVRFVYNSILKWRTDAFYEDGESINYNAASARLTALKKEFDWLSEASSVPLQQALRHQQTAFKNFFEGRAKYPVFKKKHRRQSATYASSAFKYRDGQLFIAKSKEPLDVRWSQALPGIPSTITISKDAADRYFVSCLYEVDTQALPVVAKTIGVDLGLKDLFITSDGFKSGNPKYTSKYAAKLAYLQRQLAKKAKGSRNRAKARLRVARLHVKIADCRKDATHKATRRLINENQVVCVESLAVKNMMKCPTLAKAIADANWGEFIRQLVYKGEWAGRSVVQIDRWFPSSKRCPTKGCGYINDTLPLNVRSWSCPSCGTTHDRDVAAAVNIKAVGLAVLASGATGAGVQVV
ncbi:RNA-guided endonuclease InsQ/TnpB family protein [Oceanisphaera arctica]|uniref:Transposase n=1 Tax=Oceanisphaera arctica TaxID=641510 RepID=A0A2P5THW5_9GAMM|nr:RNA-guided endonuclease TnpB family protein [Oceanisphaera arctica]PPL14166.1 transposase [Oceanisphaera arctica]GHA21767.1 transposase [Oceanisphaera arctica]